MSAGGAALVACMEAKLSLDQRIRSGAQYPSVYCRARLEGGARRTQATEFCLVSLEAPRWGAPFAFELDDFINPLRIGVWVHTQTMDSLIGEAVVPLAEFAPGEVWTGWVSLFAPPTSSGSRKDTKNGVPSESRVQHDCRGALRLAITGGVIATGPGSRARSRLGRHAGVLAFLADESQWDFVAYQVVRVQDGWSTAAERLCFALLSVLQAHTSFRLVAAFLAHVAACELSVSSDAIALFRGNGLTPKMFSAVAHLVGRKYLCSLSPLVRRVCAESRRQSHEIAPNRVRKGESVSRNQRSLETLCGVFMEKILASREAVPTEIRCLAASVERILRGHSRPVVLCCVAGFFFLRFVCPAIVAPAHYGLLDEPPPPRAQRSLVLVTKCIQRLVNSQVGLRPVGAPGGGRPAGGTVINPSRKSSRGGGARRLRRGNRVQKEPYMVVMENFVQAHSARMRRYIEALTRVGRRERGTLWYYRPDDYVNGSFQCVTEALSLSLDAATASPGGASTRVGADRKRSIRPVRRLRGSDKMTAAAQAAGHRRADTEPTAQDVEAEKRRRSMTPPPPDAFPPPRPRVPAPSSAAALTDLRDALAPVLSVQLSPPSKGSPRERPASPEVQLRTKVTQKNVSFSATPKDTRGYRELPSAAGGRGSAGMVGAGRRFSWLSPRWLRGLGGGSKAKAQVSAAWEHLGEALEERDAMRDVVAEMQIASRKHMEAKDRLIAEQALELSCLKARLAQCQCTRVNRNMPASARGTSRARLSKSHSARSLSCERQRDAALLLPPPRRPPSGELHHR